MTQAHQQIMDEISVLPAEKLGQIITFIKFVKHQNDEPIIETQSRVKKKVTFNAASVDTKNFTFCREYANER